MPAAFISHIAVSRGIGITPYEDIPIPDEYTTKLGFVSRLGSDATGGLSASANTQNFVVYTGDWPASGAKTNLQNEF